VSHGLAALLGIVQTEGEMVCFACSYGYGDLSMMNSASFIAAPTALP
jgi:hypothetical protein